eukprot:TRINITY_DN5542_c0_g1_i3.p2 TRINITY_DN5542_c0_g1~~TRINITY_DN5542_c0_g1_i3.p2  ORF type:complete len:118 (-),score=27.74 TRINITY_DN5542_c0_g1_i3:46-351(-)
MCIRDRVTGLLETDPIIYVTYGKDKRPTQDSYTWVADKAQGDSIQISKGNFENFNVTQTMAGTYMIGVFGYTESTFTLTVSFSDLNIIDLQAGIPLSLIHI